MSGYSDAVLGGFGILMAVVLVLVIGLALIPGLIANKRNHPYKGVIWAISIVGTLVTGVGWIAALIWALWPQDKSLIDPIIGNTYAQQRTAGNSNIASKLGELDAMLASGRISQAEYDELRKKALGL
jgi:hypothetical protein